MFFYSTEYKRGILYFGSYFFHKNRITLTSDLNYLFYCVQGAQCAKCQIRPCGIHMTIYGGEYSIVLQVCMRGVEWGPEWGGDWGVYHAILKRFQK